MALRLVNRIMLALAGLVLLVAGGATLAVALGAFGADRSGRRVLMARTLGDWETSDWWFPGLIGGLSALLLAALVALFAQLGRTRRRRVRIPGGEMGADQVGGHGESVVRSRAATDALVGALENIPGVDRAHAYLAGRRDTPAVRVAVTPTASALPAELTGAAISGPIADLRRSLGRADLPVEIVLRSRSRQGVGDTPRVE